MILSEGNHVNQPLLGTVPDRWYDGVLYQRFHQHWEALRRPDFSYSAFAHMLDGGGQVIAQQDHAPGEDRGYAPAVWQPEDIVADTHILAFPATGRPAACQFRVGLYNWSTGQQLPVVSPGQPPANFLLLDCPQ